MLLPLCLRLFFLTFFFSSRRRHTRLVSDWSSDVCSSDLGEQPNFSGSWIFNKSGSGWLVKARANSSGFLPFKDIAAAKNPTNSRSEEHTSELQSLTNLVCRLLLEKKKKQNISQAA